MLNEQHRISALAHYEMSDSKETKDLKSDGMAAIPLRYQGLSGKVSYGFRDTYLLDFNMGYTGSENFQKADVLGSSLQFQADGFLLNTNLYKRLCLG